MAQHYQESALRFSVPHRLCYPHRSPEGRRRVHELPHQVLRSQCRRQRQSHRSKFHIGIE
jgi:hypothetical protein